MSAADLLMILVIIRLFIKEYLSYVSIVFLDIHFGFVNYSRDKTCVKLIRNIELLRRTERHATVKY